MSIKIPSEANVFQTTLFPATCLGSNHSISIQPSPYNTCTLKLADKQNAIFSINDIQKHPFRTMNNKPQRQVNIPKNTLTGSQIATTNKLDALDNLPYLLSSHSVENYDVGHIVGFHNGDICSNLKELPPSKCILPKRKIPWISRYKIKKEMNVVKKFLNDKSSFVFYV